MLIIPFVMPPGAPRGPVVVVMILEKENLDRMKVADPFDVQLRSYRAFMPIQRPIGDLDFVIAYEENMEDILRFKERDDLPGLMRWLERGRRIQKGDVQPPVPLRRT